MRNSRKNNPSGRQVFLTEHQLNQASTENQKTQIQKPADESYDEILQIAQILFFCLTYIVTPAIKDFLCQKNLLQLLSATDYDYSELVKQINFYRKRYKYFLDPSIPLTNSTFKKAVAARNDICHLNVTSLTNNW